MNRVAAVVGSAVSGLAVLGLVVFLVACGEPPPQTPQLPQTPAEPAPPSSGVKALMFVGPAGHFALDFLEGEVHPGSNVRCLLPLPGTPTGSRPAGMFTDLAAIDTTTVYGRDAQGRLEECLPIRSAVRDLARAQSSFRSAIHDSGQGPGFDLLREAIRRLDAEPGPAHPIPDPLPFDPELAPRVELGLPLAAWAPADMLFVRFRSVEAGYRFAHEWDRLTGRILLARYDARDFGTLRLTLHHLLLPTIWRTNPDAERGVTEVALVVAPPLRRGPLRAALILRITDPDLHRMQVAAGIHQESQTDHLWRPADDPFPELRDRRNFRRTLGDVEVVATDESLLELVLRRGGPVVASDPAYVAGRARHETSRREAFFAHVPAAWADAVEGGEGETSRAAALRIAAGVDWLVERWIGFRPGAPSLDGGWATRLRSRLALDPLVHATSVQAVTDAQGAVFTLACRTAEDAAEVVERLETLTVAPEAAGRICAGNLDDLSAITQVERRAVDLAERAFVVLGFRPACPCGGSYTAHPITAVVRCSTHGTIEVPETAPVPGPGIRDVRADGSLVTFRLEIDWSRRE